MDTMENNLVDLIIQYSDMSGLSLRQMSIRAGLGESTVAIVVRGDRKPGFDFCVAIADVLKISPDEALRLAGLLPPQPAPVAEEAEILTHIRRLPEGDRDVLLRICRGLASEAPPPPLSPGPAPPIAREERNEERLIGDAIFQMDDPIRLCYEALVEVLPPPMMADFVARLAQKAAERHQEHQNDCEKCRTNASADERVPRLSGGNRVPTEANG